MPTASPSLLFAGTPAFAAAHLARLLDAGMAPLRVVCQPDRASGRGRKLQPCPVKELAMAAGIPVLQPERIRHPEAVADLLDAHADVLVVVAYGQILPRSLLEGFPGGAYNVHASLLPRWRGAAPIQRAIEAGDAETGITIQRMAERLDAGNVVHAARLPIGARDTAASLHDALAALGARALAEWLRTLDPASPPAGITQDEQQVTYARKLEKSEGRVDWTEPAVVIERRIRAFDPWPGVRSCSGAEEFRIHRAEVLAEPVAAAPGTVLQAPGDGIQVACGEQVLRLQELQFPGGRSLPVRDILNARGALFQPGARLG